MVGWAGSIATLSVALNAVLLGHLIHLHNENDVGNEDSWEETLTPEQVSKIGQTFMLKKVSELLMPQEVQEILRFENTSWQREEFVTGQALQLLSIKLSPKEKQKWTLDKDTVENIALRLREHGVVVIPMVFNRSACRQVAEKLNAEIYNPSVPFGNIMERRFRKDYPLALNGIPFEMLQDALRLVAPALKENLGENPLLTEFSSLTAYPNATSQSFHPDAGMEQPSDMERQAKLYSAFIYLDDVGENVAPFDVYPGTHTHFHFLAEEEREMMSSVPFFRLAVQQGSMAIYDSRVLHRGGPNKSQLTRPTIYFSLLQQGKPPPEGPTYSLRPTYSHTKITLSDVIQGNIPEESPMAFAKRHDDKRCHDSIRNVCPGLAAGEELYQCALHHVATKVLERQDAERLERIRNGALLEDDDEDEASVEDIEDFGEFEWEDLDHFLPSCATSSRMELVCQSGIFDPTFSTKVTWGLL